jgi:beta-galactosidase
LLGLVENKFVIGRDEFLPFSAEIHYFRVPKKFWSICFDRLKKANFRIISSYVPWNLHEERPGEFDFQGNDNPYKDLIVFLELAREFGFKIILKPGPWIQAEWPGGGMPKYIFSDESLIARDAAGGLLVANSGVNDIKPGYQPSYLHPKYINHVKRYLGGFVDAIQNYIFPKGPVFLIQLDSEMAFGGNYGLFESDYNNHIVTELYPAFLENKYGNIKNIPVGYHKVKAFASVIPPIELTFKKPEQLVPYLDWLEFKGKLIEDYVQVLKERWEALGVGCMFSVAMPSAGDFNVPVPWERIRGEKTIVGPTITETDNFYQIAMKVRLAQSLTGYSWAPQVDIGSAQSARAASGTVDIKKQRFALISALAAGLKGLNYYMFIGRDHWLGSPLGQDGTVNENYDVIRRLNLAVDVMDLSSTESNASIAIGLYRPYQMFNEITAGGEFSYIHDLVNQTFKNLSTDFCQLNYDFDVVDLDSQEHFENTRIMFVPVADYMSDAVQKKLVDLINKGMTIIFVGAVPHYNLQFKTTRVLTRGLGLETKPFHNPVHIEAGAFTFKSIAYGFISGKGSSKPIAKAGTKVVGVTKKQGKGKYYFFSYDIAAKGEPGKLSFLKSILEENGITTPVACSDPTVNVVVQFNDRGAAVYLINSDMGQSEEATKKVVVAIDLTRSGFRQAKLELMDIFGDKNIQSVSQDLKEGLIFELGRLEARLYWIPKK